MGTTAQTENAGNALAAQWCFVITDNEFAESFATPRASFMYSVVTKACVSNTESRWELQHRLKMLEMHSLHSGAL